MDDIKPKTQVSVVIPTCDRPEYVHDAVESVLVQTHRPVEILIINNGESNLQLGTESDLIQVHRLPPRVGPSRARNFGAAIAIGEYVAFLDDDDWWDPDYLEKALAVLKREGSRCVYGRKDIFKNGARHTYKIPDKKTLTIPELLRRNPGTGGQNVVLDRKLFLSIGGFDDRLRISEDRGLALDLLLLREKISIASDASVILRHHSGDRLRKYPMRKLGFLWKYRRLVSFSHFGLSLITIFLRQLKETIRRASLRTSSMIVSLGK